MRSPKTFKFVPFFTTCIGTLVICTFPKIPPDTPPNTLPETPPLKFPETLLVIEALTEPLPEPLPITDTTPPPLGAKPEPEKLLFTVVLVKNEPNADPLMLPLVEPPEIPPPVTAPPVTAPLVMVSVVAPFGIPPWYTTTFLNWLQSCLY